MPKKGKRKGSCVLLSWAIGLVVLSLAFHWELPSRAANDIYIPAAKVTLPIIKITLFDRGPKLYSASAQDAALSGVSRDRTPALLRSFIRVDRKQNLRLWPVVTSEELRAPPGVRTF